MRRSMTEASAWWILGIGCVLSSGCATPPAREPQASLPLGWPIRLAWVDATGEVAINAGAIEYVLNPAQRPAPAASGDVRRERLTSPPVASVRAAKGIVGAEPAHAPGRAPRIPAVAARRAEPFLSGTTSTEGAYCPLKP